ncbi:4078_t:CDS:1, partial [Scutellospora calospora]
FQWAGPTSKTSILSANEVQTYIFKACFVRPGVYDINRWRLTINFDQIVTGNESMGEGLQNNLAISSVHDGMKGYVQMPNTLYLLTVVNSLTDEDNL